VLPGEPDQLLLGKADGAGMIELGAQLALVDHLGEPDMPAAIDHRKGGVLGRVEFPDHLQHQELVEIGIEQAAHDRIEPPAMVVSPGRDVCDCHFATLSCREAPNQRPFVPHRSGPAAKGRAASRQDCRLIAPMRGAVRPVYATDWPACLRP
jgi:hypothetical protein